MIEAGPNSDSSFPPVTPAPSVVLRPSRAQVIVMFFCTIPVVLIVASAATAIPYLLGQQISLWYLLALPLSPGWVLARLVTTDLGLGTWHSVDVAFNAFVANFVYWFVWIFWFVLWSDRRWRRKRAARIDA